MDKRLTMYNLSVQIDGMESFIMKKYFRNWNYKKHAKLVTAVYLSLYVIDMTVGYVLAKNCLDAADVRRELKHADN